MVWLGKDSCRSTTQNKNKNSPTDQRSYISHLSLKILTINATFDFKFFSFCKQTAVLFHFRAPAFVYLFLGTRAGSSLFFFEPGRARACIFRAGPSPGYKFYASSQYEPKIFPFEPTSSLKNT